MRRFRGRGPPGHRPVRRHRRLDRARGAARAGRGEGAGRRVRDDDEPRRRGVRRDGAGLRGRRDLRVLRRAGRARRRSGARGSRRAAHPRGRRRVRAGRRGGLGARRLRRQGGDQQRAGGRGARRCGKPGAVALGDATNVAARIQSLAEPGTIVVGEATARRLEHRFVFEPLGDFEVKGRAAPVSVSRLVGPKAREPVAGATPVVGRDAEMAQLMGALGDLVAGRGRVVLLVGAPGMGKTRLLAELRGSPRIGSRGSRATASRTAASRRGRSWKRCSAGSERTSAKRRSLSGRRRGRSSGRCSAPSSTTCSPASAGCCAFESTRPRTQEAPSGSGRRTFAGWRRWRGSSRSSSRSRTCTGRTPRRGSSPRRSSTSPSARRSRCS